MVELNHRQSRFLDLAMLCRRLEATSKRKEKTLMIAAFLRSVTIDEAGLSALFLSGKAFPESDPRVLEVSYATTSEAANSQGQAQLTTGPLTIKEVYQTFDKISDASGPSSRRSPPCSPSAASPSCASTSAAAACAWVRTG